MNTETIHDEDVEIEVGGMLELIDGNGALTAVETAQVSQQVATARAYPRSITKALDEAKTLATLDEETAGSCFYTLKRGSKIITGPSARLAEIMTYSWGHIRSDADIESIDRNFVTAVGMCYDVERNTAVRVRVKRRITDKHGKRYNEDMIGVTSMAAISIALRNAAFKVIPSAFTKQVYDAARDAYAGNAETIGQKRTIAMNWLRKVGVDDAQVFALLEVKGLDDIGREELLHLRGIMTALKDGETTVEQVFRRHDVSGGAGELNEALTEKPKKAKKPKPPKDGELPPVEKVDTSLEALEKIVGVDAEQRAAIIEELDKGDPEKDPRAYKAYHERLSAMVDESLA